MSPRDASADWYPYRLSCPLPDDPVEIVGLFGRGFGTGRERADDGHGPRVASVLRRYDAEACMFRLEDDSFRVPSWDVRPPGNPTAVALRRLMRDEFDHVVRAWETWSGIHLETAQAERMLRVWRAHSAWRYYDTDYFNLPQTLFHRVAPWDLSDACLVEGGPLYERLAALPGIRVRAVGRNRLMRVEIATDSALRPYLRLADLKRSARGGHLRETFRLAVLRDGCEAFPGLALEVEAGWLTRASRDMGGRRDCRLLDVARNVLGSD